MDTDFDISGIKAFFVCERQWYLSRVEGIWADNELTVAGNVFHEVVDSGARRVSHGVRQEFHRHVQSNTLGCHGVCDVVETLPDGRIRPVEYKSGKRKARDFDRIQVTLYALCLSEELGVSVEQGVLRYGLSHVNEIVEIADYADCARQTITAMRDLSIGARRPAVSSSTQVCRACSLSDYCDAFLGGMSEAHVRRYWSKHGIDWM